MGFESGRQSRFSYTILKKSTQINQGPKMVYSLRMNVVRFGKNHGAELGFNISLVQWISRENDLAFS